MSSKGKVYGGKAAAHWRPLVRLWYAKKARRGVRPTSRHQRPVTDLSTGFMEGWPSGLWRPSQKRLGFTTLVGSNPTPSAFPRRERAVIAPLGAYQR